MAFHPKRPRVIEYQTADSVATTYTGEFIAEQFEVAYAKFIEKLKNDSKKKK